MKKRILLTLLLLLLMPINSIYASEIPIDGEAAVLIDYDTGNVLFEKNSDIKLYPASTTKILTAILAVENAKLDDFLVIDQEVVDLTDGSHIALEPGERLRMNEVLHALLISSSNDAALAIAKHVGGSVENFSRMMNLKAQEIGAMDSNFVNPNGLNDERHVSTAYDLAIIGRYAMNNEIIRSISQKTTYTIPETNKKNEPRYLKSTNKLLYDESLIQVGGESVPIKYEGALGLKTGYTKDALNCLVSYAERGEQRLIAVVLKSEGSVNVNQDTHNLLNYGFNNYFSKTIRNKNEFMGMISVLGAETPKVASVLDRDIKINTLKGKTINAEERITINKGIKAPILSGEELGKVEYLLDGEIVSTGKIVSTEDIRKEKYVPKYKKILDSWYWFVFMFLFIIRTIHLIKLKRKRRKSSRNAKR